jgi:prepilin-type N-terminal cleavage/methylation domain-containing protein
MNNRLSTGNKGFTLIEVLIAIAIFSIGVLAVGAMQVSSVKDNAIARGVTKKASLAADRMEKLLALPYDDPQLSAGSHPVDGIDNDGDGDIDEGDNASEEDGIDNDNDGQIDESGESGFITISWTVQDDTPLTGTKTIDVTVTRTTVFGGQRQVSLTSIKADL